MSDSDKQDFLIEPKRYFAVHYTLFRILGIGWWHHPDEGDTRNFPGLYLYYSLLTQIVVVVGFDVLETIDPFVGDNDIDKFMIALSFVITDDLTLIKLYILIFRNNEIQDIVRILAVDLQKFYQNHGKNKQTIKITRILTASFLFFGWVTIANTNISGIIQDIIWKAEVAKLNGTSNQQLRTPPQSIYIPWNYQSEQTYICTFLLEAVGLIWTGHIVMTIDTFIGSVILQMSSQFEILQEAITTTYKRTIEQLYNKIKRDFNDIHKTDDIFMTDFYYERVVKKYCTEKEIENALENTLKSCFRQHQILISCVEKLGSTYSYGFMTQLISSMAAMCVVMVQVSHDASGVKSIRLATSIAFFAAMVVQLAIQCFTGNEMTYQAGRVADAVMACQWERMPPRIRKLLVMMMMRAQRPLRLTAAGYANMDNDCFFAIMKAAYSYYAVLSQKQT